MSTSNYYTLKFCNIFLYKSALSNYIALLAVKGKCNVNISFYLMNDSERNFVTVFMKASNINETLF
jgi:hypothetical protein